MDKDISIIRATSVVDQITRKLVLEGHGRDVVLSALVACARNLSGNLSVAEELDAQIKDLACWDSAFEAHTGLRPIRY